MGRFNLHFFDTAAGGSASRELPLDRPTDGCRVVLQPLPGASAIVFHISGGWPDVYVEADLNGGDGEVECLVKCLPNGHLSMETDPPRPVLVYSDSARPPAPMRGRADGPLDLLVLVDATCRVGDSKETSLLFGRPERV